MFFTTGALLLAVDEALSKHSNERTYIQLTSPTSIPVRLVEQSVKKPSVTRDYSGTIYADDPDPIDGLEIICTDDTKQKIDVLITIKGDAVLQALHSASASAKGTLTWPGADGRRDVFLDLKDESLAKTIQEAIRMTLNPPDGSAADSRLNAPFYSLPRSSDPRFRDYEPWKSHTYKLPEMVMPNARFTFSGSDYAPTQKCTVEDLRGKTLAPGRTIAGFTNPESQTRATVTLHFRAPQDPLE